VEKIFTVPFLRNYATKVGEKTWALRAAPKSGAQLNSCREVFKSHDQDKRLTENKLCFVLVAA